MSTVDTVPQRLAAIREQVQELSAYLDPAALQQRVAELEDRMGAPGFWDDQETAAKVNSARVWTMGTYRAAALSASRT